MPAPKTQFVCQNCASHFSKWTGRCPSCGEWNTLVEEPVIPEKTLKNALARGANSGKVLPAVAINTIETGAEAMRLSTSFKDLNLVLGGGFLPGSVSLLAGQPGMGKSTLLMQICSFIAEKAHKVLYVSGEESARQVKLRALRLGAKSANLHFVASNSANDIATTISGGAYDFVVVDSIQTLSLKELSTAPGTVSQVSNSGNLLIRAAKASGTAVVMVGHVTKDGTLAGPKVLEHLVDVVLQFEGDRYGGFKTLRAVKNRFGATSELAIFTMSDKGLEEVKNPSAALLKERQNTDGSIILATIDGTRPLLVEIQALVDESYFNYPKRAASGFDLNRLNLLIAVLEQRTRLKLATKDIYLNVVGGIKLNDSAADLAVCMAIASAASKRKLADDLVVFGEVGLSGEIRSVSSPERRIAEAKKLGFLHALAPASIKNTFVLPVTDLRSLLIKYLRVPTKQKVLKDKGEK